MGGKSSDSAGAPGGGWRRVQAASWTLIALLGTTSVAGPAFADLGRVGLRGAVLHPTRAIQVNPGVTFGGGVYASGLVKQDARLMPLFGFDLFAAGGRSVRVWRGAGRTDVFTPPRSAVGIFRAGLGYRVFTAHLPGKPPLNDAEASLSAFFLLGMAGEASGATHGISAAMPVELGLGVRVEEMDISLSYLRFPGSGNVTECMQLAVGARIWDRRRVVP